MEDVVEQVVDSAADAVVGRTGPSNLGHLAIVSAVALGTGAGIAWYISKRYHERKYDEIAQREIAEARAFYSRLYKTDEFATPADAAEALGVGGEAAAAALESYGAKQLSEVAVEVTETVEVDIQPVQSRNVFASQEAPEVWDQDEEEAQRASLDPGTPYIISHIEFNQNDPNYEQQSLTYFAEDDVLVDEKDQPISATDEVVGEESLTRFGHGVLDDRTVYVRNDRIRMDFEVIKNEGSYSKEVLGFQHSDGPRIRKMRREFE